MPEATINEHGQLASGEGDVRPDKLAVVQPHSKILPKPQTLAWSARRSATSGFVSDRLTAAMFLDRMTDGRATSLEPEVSLSDDPAGLRSVHRAVRLRMRIKTYAHLGRCAFEDATHQRIQVRMGNGGDDEGLDGNAVLGREDFESAVLLCW